MIARSSTVRVSMLLGGWDLSTLMGVFSFLLGGRGQKTQVLKDECDRRRRGRQFGSAEWLMIEFDKFLFPPQ